MLHPTQKSEGFIKNYLISSGVPILSSLYLAAIYSFVTKDMTFAMEIAPNIVITGLILAPFIMEYRKNNLEKISNEKDNLVVPHNFWE